MIRKIKLFSSGNDFWLITCLKQVNIDRIKYSIGYVSDSSLAIQRKGVREFGLFLESYGGVTRKYILDEMYKTIPEVLPEAVMSIWNSGNITTYVEFILGKMSFGNGFYQAYFTNKGREEVCIFEFRDNDSNEVFSFELSYKDALYLYYNYFSGYKWYVETYRKNDLELGEIMPKEDWKNFNEYLKMLYQQCVQEGLDIPEIFTPDIDI